jgi:hypothetical protein
LIAIQWHSGGGKIACVGQFGQIGNGIYGDVNRLDRFATTSASVTKKIGGEILFRFSSDTRVCRF